MSLISYGFVLVNPRTEILLGHVTGQDCWDIPKGGADPGEQPLTAALRELQEETSIVLAEPPVELGLCAYTKRKKLHLFTAKVGLDAYPVESLTCL
ncbi:NUDIX domain-containing protein, partial [Nostoc sp. CHAB 5834]|nr:NUDIX domain-containing protein [Nostoc sp. CHAB 5834]